MSNTHADKLLAQAERIKDKTITQAGAVAAFVDKHRDTLNRIYESDHGIALLDSMDLLIINGYHNPEASQEIARDFSLTGWVKERDDAHSGYSYKAEIDGLMVKIYNAEPCAQTAQEPLSL